MDEYLLAGCTVHNGKGKMCIRDSLFSLCDQETLARLERNNMEFNDLKAYGAAIESIEVYDLSLIHI